MRIFKICSVLVMLLLALGATASAASERREPALTDEAVVDACAREANELNAAAWTCLGGALTYLESPGESSSTSDDVWTTRQVVAVPPPEESLSPSPDGPAPMGAGDPWDPWCEYGTSCERMKDPASKYILERKQNGAWGDHTGVRGTYDVILLTNLNGRQVRYRLGFEIDSGPSIVFDTKVNCVKNQLFDGTCGSFYTYKSVSNWWQGQMQYMDRIPNNRGDNYFSTVTGTIEPAGWGGGPIQLGGFTTSDFICPNNSSGNCYFP
ncbi:hypothetical protein [Salana multivorans]